ALAAAGTGRDRTRAARQGPRCGARDRGGGRAGAGGAAEGGARGGAGRRRADVVVGSVGAAAAALAQRGARPGVADRGAGGACGGGAGGGGRALVAGSVDPAAHAGATGRRRAALPRRGPARQPPLPSRVIRRSELERRKPRRRYRRGSAQRSLNSIGTRPIACTAWPSWIAGRKRQ